MYVVHIVYIFWVLLKMVFNCMVKISWFSKVKTFVLNQSKFVGLAKTAAERGSCFLVNSLCLSTIPK